MAKEDGRKLQSTVIETETGWVMRYNIIYVSTVFIYPHWQEQSSLFSLSSVINMAENPNPNVISS